MDNKGNKITSFKSLSNMSNRFAAYHQLGLNKGDLNYSGSVTEEECRYVNGLCFYDISIV